MPRFNWRTVCGSTTARVATPALVLVLWLPIGNSVGGEPPDTTPPKEKVKGADLKLQELLKEAREADQKYLKLIAEVRPTLKSAEKRLKLVIENDPSLPFARRAFEIAKENPRTVVGVMALRHVCACGHTSRNTDLIALKGEALKHLEELYTEEKWFWAFLPAVAVDTTFCDVRPFLRRCLEKSSHREVRAQACIHLADRTLRRQRFLNQGGDTLPADEEREMVALYERCVKDFGELPTSDTTIGKAAERSLFEIRNLAVGKPAPKTVGKDIDGEALDLADYRGKVVVLVFWGDWCLACRQALPGEQALADKFKDDPVVFLGINSDPRDKARKAIARDKITWRSWWDGGDASGPIATTWNVTAWPTTYVLDHTGVIRFRYFSKVSDGNLQKNVERLLKELPRP